MERPLPYHLAIELARGKVNQVRCQSWDWQAGGLEIAPELAEQIHAACITFGNAVARTPSEEGNAQAQAALRFAYGAADDLVAAYQTLMFTMRHERQPRLDTRFGCRLGSHVPQGRAADGLTQACNAVSLPLSWSEVEPEEAGACRWETHDALVEWASQ